MEDDLGAVAMEEQTGKTAVIARAAPAESVARASAESKPLIIGLPGPLPLVGEAGPLGKRVGQTIDGLLEGQTQIEIERVDVHIHLKDPEAWED